MTVLLVDDHPLFLDGLEDLLRSNGLEVAGMARDGVDAIEKARTLAPNAILMDIHMPRLDGLAAVRAIKADLPEIKIVMLTMSEADDDLFEAVKSGASGYLLKSQSPEELLALLRGLERGEAVFSPGLAARILHEFGRQATALEEKRRTAGLSEREREVLTLVAQGIGVWIGFQTFINMGVNMGVLPTKGLTLPLLSFGGSGIVANCIAVAILLRIDYENRQLLRGFAV
jgi:two-component system NarL family response regulator